jgi:hypothetical protein
VIDDQELSTLRRDEKADNALPPLAKMISISNKNEFI